MSRIEALDAVVTSVGGKVGAGATAATSTNAKGEVNVSGVLTGIAKPSTRVWIWPPRVCRLFLVLRGPRVSQLWGAVLAL
jgi:hypothetical protein